MSKVVIDLMRHGHCEGGEVFRGSSDMPLSHQGEKHMYDMLIDLGSKYFKYNGVPYHSVICSPLQRCKRVASHYASANNLPCIVQADLREYHFGDWEAEPIERVWANSPELVSAWYRDPVNASPPNAEPYNDFASRVWTAFEESIYSRIHAGDERMLLVVHAGVIRCILSHILGIPVKYLHNFDVPHVCVTRIEAWLSQDAENHLTYRLCAHNFAEACHGD